MAEKGISIRYIEQFDIAKDQEARREDVFASPVDAALFLAMRDTREIPMAQKMADALEFVSSRTAASTDDTPQS